MPIDQATDFTITQNLDRLLQEVQETSIHCNRDLEDIEVMVVSKTRPIEYVQSLYEQGHILFGENRVQEAQEKFSDLHDIKSEIDLHLIGTLQKNKLSKAISFFDCIQSVDSIALLQALIQALENNPLVEPYPIYLQVRSSDFDFKHGFDNYELLKEALSIILAQDVLRLEGLMTIAPFSTDEYIVRKAFALTRNYRDALLQEYKPAISSLLLSMGMSGDYKWAIEEGSNLIRVGSAIFGERLI